LQEDRLNGVAHCREQHVIRSDHHQHGRIERPITIESHASRKHRNAHREDNSDYVRHRHSLGAAPYDLSSRAANRTAWTTSRIAWLDVCAAVRSVMSASCV